MTTRIRTKEEGKQSSTDKAAHSSAKRQGRTARWSERGREQPDPGPTDHPVLHLQRSHGNQAVQRLVRSGAIQTKLRVNDPGDRHRQEADRVAEQVLRIPEPDVLQRKRACGGTLGPAGEYAACRRQRVAGSLQPKLSISQPGDKYEREANHVAEMVMQMPALPGQQQIPSDEEGEAGGERSVHPQPAVDRISTLVQREAGVKEGKDVDELVQPEPNAVTPRLENGIGYLQGGQPLNPTARSFFESRFGHNFSEVRVHTDAAEFARSINARAFTVGRHVVFGRGQYAPATAAGKRLLAHELTHVLQQRGNTPVSVIDPPHGLIQRDLQRIENLLKERFVDPEDPRLHKRRQSLNTQFRLLNALDAYSLLSRIMNPTQEDVISKRFQTLHRSPRRELLLILLNKLRHIEAENLHQTLTHAAETSAEQRLQARFQEIAPEKNVREELLERLHSKFSSAHLAPLGTKTPWVNLNDANFKTIGSISPDNNCRACRGSEFNKLGVNWSTSRNAMELRGDIAGHRSDAQYNFRRTMESGTWIKVGSWRQIEYDAPGTNDDAGDTDEDLTPGLNHIYVVDAPGFSSLNPADVHFLPRNTSEYVSKHNFEEWVEVRIGRGSWSRASDIFQWHSSVWLKKVNGNWQRKKDELNEISPGFMPVGEQDTPL